MKILILGHRGMAGHILFDYLKKKGYDVLNADEILGRKFDALFDLDDLELKLKEEKVDVIINCIGILVKMSEEDPILAIKINSLFPHKLANFCSNNKIKLIHLSTDCYLDDNIYGRSKRAGEVDYGGHLTVRTSIVGPELKENGVGLFNWFMKQEGEIEGYSNVLWDGVTTLELAKFMDWYLKNEINLSGIRNLRCSKPISKYKLLHLFKKIYDKEINIIEYPNKIENKTEKNDFLNYFVPTYEKMVTEMKNFSD